MVELSCSKAFILVLKTLIVEYCTFKIHSCKTLATLEIRDDELFH